MNTLVKLTKSLIALSLLIAPLTSSAQDVVETEETPQVMMIGMFHFTNPGRDVIKVDKVIDVTSDESQAYLTALSERIASEFNPTVVLLEYNPENDAVMQERFQGYLAGTYELGVNEIYQVGFRAAKMAGARIASFDERNVNWEAEQLFAALETGYPEIKAIRDQWIVDFTAQMEEDNRTLTLQEKLQKYNKHETDLANMDSYLFTNVVGVGENFEGAIAAASWWKRNFFMYAKIQRHAAPGERIFVVGGQGHTAILKGLLEADSHLEGVDIYPLL